LLKASRITLGTGYPLLTAASILLNSEFWYSGA